MQTNIAIFASGGGSNAEELIRHFEQDALINIALIVSNRDDAYVLERAENHDIPYYVHASDDQETGLMLALLKVYKIDYIVLAGYLKKISPSLIKQFPNKIINIHPALLPKYGGKGMYGMHVHKAVEASGDKISGITIHFVNENYDEGNIIAQFSCELSPEDDANMIQKKVLALEHAHFAETIEKLIKTNR
jgi:phosphoribosylglycinamide formyltransferase-1